MRGFVFTLDALFAVIAALFVIFFFSSAFSVKEKTSTISLRMQAEDDVMMRFYANAPISSSSLSSQAGECAIGFKPVVSNTVQFPSQLISWVSFQSCRSSP